MGVITKAYTFSNVGITDASSVNRVIDDLYNLQNGNLNSANMISTFTWAASQITVNDTASIFVGSDVETILTEVNNKVITETIQSATVINSIGTSNQQYAGHILTTSEPGTTSSNIRALYLFVSGSITTDEMGTFNLVNGGTGSVANTTDIMGGNQGVEFLGNSTTWYYNGTLLDASATAITIDFWFNCDDGYNTAGNTYLIMKDNVSAADSFYVYINNCGALVFQTEEGNSGTNQAASVTVLPNGQTGWNYVVASQDKTFGMRLWINGVLDAQNVSATNIMGAGTAGEFKVGTETGAAGHYDGKMCLLRVRTCAITQKDVDVGYSVKYNAPTTITGDEYGIRAFRDPNSISSQRHLIDWDEIEVTRNSASIYRAGGIITDLSANDSLKIVARG